MVGMLSRRGFVGGLITALAAPAIVHAGRVMPVRALPLALRGPGPLAVTRKAFIPRLYVSSFCRPPSLDVDWDAPAFAYDAIEVVEPRPKLPVKVE